LLCLQVVVIQAKNKFEVLCASNATFREVKLKLSETVGMSIESQKLIFKVVVCSSVFFLF
jgi:hypothetical protein